MTLLMKHLSQTRNCREVFLRLRVLRNAPSNSARSPRQPDLPEPAAATLLFRKELVFKASNGEEMSLNAMWNRRQCTKFNGTSYIVQKGAEVVFSEEGIRECQENINYYKRNAKVIADTMTKLGIRFFGGINSPYIWFECPKWHGILGVL